MPTSSSVYNQMQGIQAQMNPLLQKIGTYNPVDAGDVNNDLLSRVNFFKPQLQEIANTETQANTSLPQAMQQYNTTYGATDGPSAMTRLSSILQNFGNIMGTANTQRGILDTQRGRIGDTTNSVLGLYNGQRDQLKDQYSMLNNQYGTLSDQWKTALQLEEADRQRRAAQTQADNQARALQDMISRSRAQSAVQNSPGRLAAAAAIGGVNAGNEPSIITDKSYPQKGVGALQGITAAYQSTIPFEVLKRANIPVVSDMIGRLDVKNGLPPTAIPEFLRDNAGAFLDSKQGQQYVPALNGILKSIGLPTYTPKGATNNNSFTSLFKSFRN